MLVRNKNDIFSKEPPLVIIDYGLGNIKSIVNACNRIGENPIVVTTGNELYKICPSHIIMPGVGAVGEAIKRLNLLGIKDVLTELVLDGDAAYLGICVGMQILVETCEEFGNHKGLGWVPGLTRPINCPNKKVSYLPHVGWNTINVVKEQDPMLKPFDNEDVYFCHSNAVETDEEFVVSTTNYECDFVSSIKKDRIYGVQFHPEKSSALGEKLLSSFVKI